MNNNENFYVGIGITDTKILLLCLKDTEKKAIVSCEAIKNKYELKDYKIINFNNVDEIEKEFTTWLMGYRYSYKDSINMLIDIAKKMREGLDDVE